MAFVIKAEIQDPGARAFVFEDQKTMYGGKRIAVGDEIFLFASENEGGAGLVARGVVTSVDASGVRRPKSKLRYTPRVSVAVRRTASARRRLGREELKAFTDSSDRSPQAELAWKFYRQATNMIGGISDEAAAFLRRCF